jgi:hypothetical protein
MWGFFRRRFCVVYGGHGPPELFKKWFALFIFLNHFLNEESVMALSKKNYSHD